MFNEIQVLLSHYGINFFCIHEQDILMALTHNLACNVVGFGL